MNLKRTLASLGCMVLLTVTLTGGIAGNVSHITPVCFSETMEEGNTMTAIEFAAEMKIGWNLGNTFDAPLGETAWGNPVTTKELLLKVKELGFETIRIPISWGKHVSPAPEYAIDEGFLNRVDAVVNDALDAGLHVIINSHHDNEIYMPTPENSQQAKAYLTAIWTQIGNHFINAPYSLVFETMNEPRVVGTSYEWGIDYKNPDCMAAVEVVNELNQAALDAIRSTGGKNADRFVMISPYAAAPGSAVASSFRLPEDSVDGKLMVSVHSYTPYSFALDIHSDDTDFGRKDENEIRSILKSVNHRFVEKGIPVVIGETGCLNKSNPEDRYAWAKTFVSAAREYGIPCIWWDNGQINGSQENFGLIDRKSVSVYEQSQTVYQGLMDGLIAELFQQTGES